MKTGGVYLVNNKRGAGFTPNLFTLLPRSPPPLLLSLQCVWYFTAPLYLSKVRPSVWVLIACHWAVNDFIFQLLLMKLSALVPQQTDAWICTNKLWFQRTNWGFIFFVAFLNKKKQKQKTGYHSFVYLTLTFFLYSWYSHFPLVVSHSEASPAAALTNGCCSSWALAEGHAGVMSRNRGAHEESGFNTGRWWMYTGGKSNSDFLTLFVRSVRLLTPSILSIMQGGHHINNTLCTKTQPH